MSKYLLIVQLVKSNVLTLLSSMPFTNPPKISSPDSSSTYYFASISITELLAQAMDYLIACYEELGQRSKALVLMQFGWPRYRTKFTSFVKAIPKSGFAIPFFFDFIVSIAEKKWSYITIPCDEKKETTKLFLSFHHKEW